MNNVKKGQIEDFIVGRAREQLTNENIELIAKTVCEISKQDSNEVVITAIKKSLKDNKKALDNLLNAIELGEHMELLSERIQKKKDEKEELERQLANEQMKHSELDEKEIKFFLTALKNGDINDIKYKRAIIAVFVNAIYLYDDRATIVFNASDTPAEIDFSLLDGNEESSNSAEKACNCNGVWGSYMKETSPPNENVSQRGGIFILA